MAEGHAPGAVSGMSAPAPGRGPLRCGAPLPAAGCKGRRRRWHMPCKAKGRPARSAGGRREEDEARDGGQRHGRRAHARRAAEDRTGPLRHHRVRRRAAPELQPRAAVAGAGRRADAGRDHPQPAVLVCSARHHAAPGQDGHADRPRAPPRGGPGRPWRRGLGRLRPAAGRHRLQPLHAAAAGRRAGGRHRLPRHRRHPGHDRRRRDLPACGGHRRRPAGAGGRQRPAAARHAGDGGAPERQPDGAPARHGRCRAAARIAARPRAGLPARRPHAGAAGRCGGPGARRAVGRFG